MMYNGDVKKADTKDSKIPKDGKIPMRHLVDNLPNDQLLDEFEHTEGTYKDYSRMTHDTLSDEEIKSFEAGQKGEVYEPEPMCKCPKYEDADEDENPPMSFAQAVKQIAQAVEQTVARRKGGLSAAVEKLPTDDELDKQEAEELMECCLREHHCKAYKEHFTEEL